MTLFWIIYIIVTVLLFIIWGVFYHESNYAKRWREGSDAFDVTLNHFGALVVCSGWIFVIPALMVGAILWVLTLGARWIFREIARPKENV